MRTSISVSLFLIVLCLISCSSDDDTSTMENIVGKDGKTIELEGVTIVFPRDAVEKDTAIAIEKVSAPTSNKFTPFGDYYRIRPDGLDFKYPVTIKIPYDKSLVPSGKNADEILVFTAAEFTAEWTSLNTTVDAEKSIVSADTSHFSIFGLGVSGSSIDGDIDATEVVEKTEKEETEATSGGKIVVIEKLEFGLVKVGEIHSLDLQIRNEGEEELTITGATIEGTDKTTFTLKNQANTVLAKASSIVLKIEFAPTKSGKHEAVLKIVSDDSKNPDIEVSLVGTGSKGGKIEVKPDALLFEAESKDQQIDKTFTIKNVAAKGSGLLISKIELIDSTGFFSIKDIKKGTNVISDFPHELEGEGEIVVTVSYVAKEMKIVSRGVDIYSDDPDNPMISVSLVGKYGDYPDGDSDTEATEMDESETTETTEETEVEVTENEEAEAS